MDKTKGNKKHYNPWINPWAIKNIGLKPSCINLQGFSLSKGHNE
jgi:hypothetical protein